MIRSRQTYRPLNMMPIGAGIFLVALCVFSIDGFALPEDQNTVAGSVSVEQTDENTLRIDQHSSHAISEWSSFNIDAHESVNIFQPSQSSILLNRILSEDPTQILGNLNANGQVWLMDGAGVMFGEDATINVGGLLVTTADIENEQFMQGNYRFDQAGAVDAAIINEGRITTDHGPVGFFASNVSNRGTIHAKLSSVNLGATETFAIDFYGDGLMQVSLDPLETDQDVRSAEYKAQNSGEIEALAGTVEMSVAQGNAVVERMIEQTGAISVDSVGYDAAGNVVLGGGSTATTKVSGTISANSYGDDQSGGMIEVQGKVIEIASTAKLSADGSGVAASSTEAAPETRGENGGGTIRIGGEYKGGGDMPTAERTLVDFGAEISANAIGSGDGGEVIVWADEVTHFGGHIDVRGGDDGGHGGFVEVSGKEYLDFQGSTNRSAVNGNAGTLLLDPRNITISAGGNSGFPALTSPFDPNADNAVLNVTTLETELGVGDVIVTTGVNGVQAGNIQVSAAITGPANGSSLSLLAANDITISQDIDMSAGTGGLTITADSDGSGAGTFNLNGGSDLTTNNAQIIITADDMILNGTIDSGTAATSLLKSDGDTIGIASGAGSMGLSAAELDTITAGSLVIGGANAGNITIDDLDGANDLDKITGDVTFTAGAAGSNVTFNGTNSNFSNGLNVNATDGITISNDLVTNGTTSLDADSDDDGAGDTTIGIGDSINTTGNALTITQHDMTLLGTINSGVASTTLLVSNGGTMELGGLGGDFSLLDLTIDSITAGSLTFGDATAGAITIAADVSPANATALHLHTGSTITGTAGGIIEDSLALTAGGLVDFTDASTDVDNLAVSAAGQTVNFTDTDDINITTVSGVTGVTATTFDLTAGTTIDDAQAITATNLALTAGGTILLNVGTTDVDNLAISAAGQTVSFTDADDVDIDMVGGVTGVTATTFNLNTGGAVTDNVASTVAGTTTIAAGAGNNVTLDAATNDFATVAITSGNDVTLVDQNALILGASTISGTLAADAVANLTINGNVTTNGATTLDADSDDDGTGDFLVNGGFTVDTSNNALSVIADDVTLTGNLDSGAATTTFLVSNGGTIDIGAGGGGNLNLTQAEIDNATAAGITIGNAAAGAITVSSDITPANTSILHLHTGSTITGTAGGIIEDSLALTAGGLVDFTDASTDVDNLAVSAAGQTVNFTDTDDITIGTVSGVVDATATTLNLIATSGGAINGDVTVDNLTVDTSSAVLTGTIMGGVGQAAADMITIGGVEGAGPYTLNGFCFGSNCPAPTPDPDDTAVDTVIETDQETESVLDTLTDDASSSDDLGYFEESGSFDSGGDEGGGASSFASTADDSGGGSSSNQGLKINGQYVNLDSSNPCPGVKLKAGDTVEAGKGGGCLSTSEGSKLKMDSGTQVNVYKVFYSPDGKESTFFDIPDGSAMFISKPGEHKDEIRTSVPGVTIKVTGTCYIVDHDKVNNQTTMVLFGGGMELYIKGQLLKMKSPIEMVTFGANTNEKIEPVSITMDTVRKRFGESVIPSPDELRACGLRNEDL